MKDSLVQQCLDILKRDDIKSEFKMLLKPVIDFILYEIKFLCRTEVSSRGKQDLS